MVDVIPTLTVLTGHPLVPSNNDGVIAASPAFFVIPIYVCVCKERCAREVCKREKSARERRVQEREEEKKRRSSAES